jgi:hypothetical protein
MNTGFAANMQASGPQAARGELLIQEQDLLVQGWTAPGEPLSACGAGFYLHSYGLALRVEALDDGGRPLTTTVSQGGSALLHFPEGVTEAAFDVPALQLHGTVAPAAEVLAGSSDRPISLYLEMHEQPLYAGTVSPGETVDVPGGRLALYAEHFLVVEAVHDPGWMPFLLAGLSLAAGSGLSLLLPQRRLWARWSESGTLQVRLGNRGAGALAAETATLRSAAQRDEGGAP